MAKITIQDGTSQDERLLPALKEGYFNVDEMRFEDLLSFAPRYAGFLKYFDHANRGDGSWRGFFETDEACVLASILTLDAQRIEAEFPAFIKEMRQKIARFREGGAGVEEIPAFSLALKMDAWFAGLSGMRSVAAAQASEIFRELIEKTLRTELQRLRLFLMPRHQPGAASAFQRFSPVWECTAARPGLKVPAATADRGAIARFLKSNFQAFLNALLFLQERVRKILPVSLERDDHDPSIGLYLAFLKLYGKVQDRLNGFTSRHLHFYYEDVLKAERRDFLPDSAWLIFAPDVPGREVLVKKGTGFKAGLDEKNAELFYAADNDLLVTDAKVGALHTLYFERNSLSSPENALASPPGADGQPRTFITAAKWRDIDVKTKKSALADGEAPSYPLFGVPRRSMLECQSGDAEMGFAIASHVLRLGHGQRDITLTFKLAADGEGAEPAAFVEKLGQVLETAGADAFFKAFRHMFRISLTGESGWIDVKEYLPLSRTVDPEGCEDNSFKIQIRLSDGDGAVAPWSPEVHGGGFDAGLPVIKFIVNPGGYLYPYSLLQRLPVREILIETEVKGCTSVQAYNQFGPLNANVQFAPFGPAPSLGDYFIVGCHEAAIKKLRSFEVDVEWSGLPQEANGFAEYYRAYPAAMDNAAFRVNLSVLRGRKWVPGEEEKRPRAKLFESENAAGSGKTGKKSLFSFQGLCNSARPLEDAREAQYGYDAMSKDGFFKLTLAAPSGAFGHREYPLVLSKVMIENARRKKLLAKLLPGALPSKPLPNPPYTPQINAIAVNYTAYSRISLETRASEDEERLTDQLFHLHPLGLERLSALKHGQLYLVPRYEADGNLFIGIEASRLPGTLTLFFHLREDSRPEASTQEFDFRWHYLASNQWKPFKSSQVISDTTNGFLASGIVTLEIPGDINQENTVMPGGCYWIRVSADGEQLNTLCTLHGVHAQALRVTWERQPGNSLSHLANGLAAGRIKEARQPVPGIGEIRQIMESSGGAPEESREQWITRVSERLRHKNRAVTAADYERLILQRFPGIYKVKCFPCMTDDETLWRRAVPGRFLIVVIPCQKASATANPQPMVNALLLKEIRQFVEGLSSAFVKFTVRNPAYEQVQVRCKAKFKRGASRGYCLKSLNEELVNYFSPWSGRGLEARFGWRIRCNDVLSHIQELDYVESVSGLSLLRIVESDDRRHYRLTDTARDGVSEILPFHPWSIAVPFRSHLVEAVDESGYRPAEATGVGNLAVGGTFILSGEGQ